MKDSGSAPQAPDPKVTIPLQTAANKDMFNYALDASRVNQVTPYGIQSWDKTPSFDQAGYDAALADWNRRNTQGTWVQTQPQQYNGYGDNLSGSNTPGGANGGYWSGASSDGTPMPTKDQFTKYDWTYKTQLSPEQQKLYDANVGSQLQQADLLKGLASRVQEATANPLDLSGAPQINLGDGSADAFLKGLADRSVGNNFSNNVADATYGQATRYLDPQFQQNQQSMEARLAEQGFVPGTPGYDRAMANFLDTRNRAYGQAKDAAITAGYGQANQQLALQNQIAQILGNRQNQTFNQSLTNRSRAIAEALQQRQYPLNELNAMRTGTQVQAPSNPAQYQTPSMPSVDVLGAYNQKYQGDLGAYNAEVASNNADMGALLGLGSLAFGGGGLGGLFSGMGGGLVGTAGSGLKVPSGFQW